MDLPVGEIVGIQFGIYSDAMIQAMSVVEVNKPTLYLKGRPLDHGANDLRMGITDRMDLCKTCNSDLAICPGHFGRIQLPQPVFHAGFWPLLLKTLQCLCHRCAHVLFRDNQWPSNMNFLSHKERWNKLTKCAKCIAQCPWCEAPVAQYRRQNGQIVATFKSRRILTPEDEQWQGDLTPQKALSVFERVSQEDLENLGFRPEVGSSPVNFIVKSLLVPPPIVRPSVVVSEGSRTRGHDDITQKLVEIVKECQNSHFNALQQLANTYLYHDAGANGSSLTVPGTALPSYGQGTNGARSRLRCRMIYHRYKGKKGRFRWNCQGKRVNGSARTVISPDPQLDIDQVGVPREVAQELLIRERVFISNLEAMRDRIRRGPRRLDGAASFRYGKVCVELGLITKEKRYEYAADLNVGAVVDRYLQDGDYVIMNRQPSLHKMSMMGHRVQLIEGRSFRIPLSCTPAYNADFDGDEMNLHTMMDLEATAELQHLMAVPFNIVSPQNNRPVISLIQDSILASYLLTHKDTFIEREDFCQLVCQLRYQIPTALPQAAILKPQVLWTGKQAFGMTLPRGIYMQKVANHRGDGNCPPFPEAAWDLEERGVYVRNGRLLCGRLCKSGGVGVVSQGLTHIINNDCGPQKAKEYLSDASLLLHYYLTNRGFSVTFADCLLHPEIQKAANEIVDRVIHHADTQERSEANNSRILQSLLPYVGSLLKSTLRPMENSLVTLEQAGSKGNIINLVQITATVGQQTVDGARPVRNRIQNRALSCFPPGMNTASSRGFVRSSYMKGLSPSEYFFHAMGGREGLVDTSVRTATTGYVQRRLMKIMESLGVMYDGTVRDPAGKIIQFQYGGDGMDPKMLEHNTLHSLRLNRRERHQRYGPLPTDPPELQIFGEWQMQHLEKAWIQVVKARIQLEGPLQYVILSPFTLPRLLAWAQEEVPKVPGTMEDHLNQLKTFLQTLEQRPQFPVELILYIHEHVHSRTLLQLWKVLPSIIERIYHKIIRSQADPGQQVGPEGSQSVGEPSTQMTLNTFHLAGVGEKRNVVMGMPRLKELIGVMRKIRTPLFTAPLLVQNEEQALEICDSIQQLMFQEIVHVSRLLPQDQWNTFELLSFLYQLDDPFEEHVCPYFMHFVISPKYESLVFRAAAALESCTSSFRPFIRYGHLDSSPNAPVVIQVAFQEPLPPQSDPYTVLKERQSYLLSNCLICGLENVTYVGVRSEGRPRLNEELGSIEIIKVWMLEAQYCAENTQQFLRLCALQEVVTNRAISNDVNVITQALGIEAAGLILHMEILSILCQGGSSIDHHHTQLLVDLMSVRGVMTPLSRQGMPDLGSSVVQQASFENTMEVLFQAAAMGSKDPLGGVTESVMVGKRAHLGTGLCELIPKT